MPDVTIDLGDMGRQIGGMCKQVGVAGALSPSATATIREGHRQLLHSISDVIAQQLPNRGPSEREQLAEFVSATILAASRLAIERDASPTLRRVLKRTLRAMLEA